MRILLIDDVESLREMSKVFLTRLGHHKVTLSENGNDAFRTYKKRGPYDVVLTDVDHSGLDGIELAKCILQKNPKQKIGFVTAYKKGTISLPEGCLLLEKPFSMTQLLEFVEKVKTI